MQNKLKYITFALITPKHIINLSEKPTEGRKHREIWSFLCCITKNNKKYSNKRVTFRVLSYIPTLSVFKLVQIINKYMFLTQEMLSENTYID